VIEIHKKAKMKATWHEKTHKCSKTARQRQALKASEIKTLETNFRKSNLGKISIPKDMGNGSTQSRINKSASPQEEAMRLNTTSTKPWFQKKR
jgi:hypothetical protein